MMMDAATKKYTTAVGALVVTVVAIWVTTKWMKPKKKKEDALPVARIFANKEAVAAELCAFVAQQANQAIANKQVFHLAVAGGSLLDLLTKLPDYKDSIDFSKVVLSFVNHKCVPPNDNKSTLQKTKTKFANAAGITNIVEPQSIPVLGGDGSAEAAYYAQALRNANVPQDREGFPVLDLILLGLGGDGHVGSCHPMGAACLEQTKTVANSTGEPASITLTIESMNRAKTVVVVVCGAGKSLAVHRAMTRPAELPHGSFPAQLLKGPLFFLDAEAAADL